MSFYDDPPNQCTSHAAALCSWIPGNLGDADTWASEAAAEGFPVSHNQSVGSVAQWPPGWGGSSPKFGHVAVVTVLMPSGGIQVSEQNWADDGRIGTRNIAALTAAGLWFITAKGPITDGVAMTPAERLEEARAAVDEIYFAMGHRDPEGPPPAGQPTVRDAWALVGVAQGIPQMLEQIAASPEFSADARADYARDHPPV